MIADNYAELRRHATRDQAGWWYVRVLIKSDVFPVHTLASPTFEGLCKLYDRHKADFAP